MLLLSSVRLLLHYLFKSLLAPFGRLIRIICALMVLVYGADLAFCLQPTSAITQYAHTAWRSGESGLDSLPSSIAQTADGYIWIGSKNGLYRFDGIRFSRWSPLPGELLPVGQIAYLFGARDGSLYIGSETGLARLTRGHLYVYRESLRWPGPFLEDREGRVWMGDQGNYTTASALCSIGAERLDCKGTKDGLGCVAGWSNTLDKDGSIWIGSSEGICRWKDGVAPESFLLPALRKSGSPSSVSGLATDENGALWAGMTDTGEGSGLLKYSNGKWNTYVTSAVDGRRLPVESLLSDRQGSLWIGTVNRGLYRLVDGRLDHFDVTDGLSGDQVERIFEDREGNLWVITRRGVDHFRDFSVVSYGPREGLNEYGTHPLSLIANQDNSILLVGNNLSMLRGERFTIAANEAQLPIHPLDAAFRDHNNRIWIGGYNQFALYEGGKFKFVTGPRGRNIGDIVAISEDNLRELWAFELDIDQPPPRHRSLIHIREMKIVESFDSPAIAGGQTFVAMAPNPRGGLWLGGAKDGIFQFHDGTFEKVETGGPTGFVKGMLTDADGTLWAATVHGFIGVRDGHIRKLTSAEGLPCDSAQDIVYGGDGSAWLRMECGIVRVSRDELNRWWANSHYRIQCKTLVGLDGAESDFGLATVQTPDGRLWFPGFANFQMLDPTHLPVNSLPPPVHIENLLADHRSYPVSDSMRLPKMTRNLEIDYVGLSYVMPDRVRFRYRLDGHETSWNDAGTRRQAFYNDLPPGHYTFHVLACNNDGVWNEEGVALAFFIPPAWYQTYWFFAACAFLLLSLGYFFYRRKTLQYAETLRLRFDERLEERTRLARDLHDTLLQTIQGSKMVADDACETVDDPVRTRKALYRLSEWLGRATVEGRAALKSLRTSTTEIPDLAAAFRSAAEDCLVSGMMVGSVTVVGKPRDMHPIVQDEVYRIGYEAIRNAAAHSEGNALAVQLNYGRDLELQISDNGQGIDGSILDVGRVGHYGLISMRERAEKIDATLTISSSPGHGTTVSLKVLGKVIFRA